MKFAHSLSLDSNCFHIYFLIAAVERTAVLNTSKQEYELICRVIPCRKMYW